MRLPTTAVGLSCRPGSNSSGYPQTVHTDKTYLTTPQSPVPTSSVRHGTEASSWISGYEAQPPLTVVHHNRLRLTCERGWLGCCWLWLLLQPAFRSMLGV